MPSVPLQRAKSYILREKAVLLLPLIAVWCGLTLSPEWHPTWDSAMYIAMGKSIISGDGVRYMGYGGIKYPPGFPLMLGLIIGPFGYNFLLMRLFVVGCAVGSAWLAYLIVRDRSDRWLAAGVMCATVCSYAVFFECVRILADLPYTFLSLLALRWVERYAKSDEGWRSRTGAVAIGLIVAAYFTRIVGLTLFAGAAAYLALGGRGARPSRMNFKKAVAVGLVLVVVPTVWTVQNQLRGPRLPSELREALSYEKEFLSTTSGRPDAPRIGWNELVARVGRNVGYYEQRISSVLLGRPLGSRLPIHGAALILIGGFVYCLVRRRGAYEYYVPIYLLVCAMWTTRQGERFLVPVIPILLFYAFRSVTLILAGLRRILAGAVGWENGRGVTHAVAVVLLTGAFFASNWGLNAEIIEREQRDPYYDEEIARIFELARWLKENTPPETIVVSDKPAYIYLFSDRKTFGFPWVKQPARVFDSIRDVGADYVIWMPSQRSRWHLHPMLRAYLDRFEIVHRRGPFLILRVKDERSGR